MQLKIIMLILLVVSTVSAREVGEKIGGFVVIKSQTVAEIACNFVQLEHEKSGAQVVYIEADDPENFFSIAFRTPASSSNGVAHVLEHTVLCASEKFPTKDLFFAMRRRSMHTYMNAATGADYTYFPAASMVEEDFYNLLTVYLDAVFHPLLRPISLAQEGSRLAFINPHEPSSPLEYKGVVYNEMKGALASPRRFLYETARKELFPDSPYGYNSGGIPEEIVQLTHDELVAFHERYYYPANCLFFFYGNLPLEKHLDFLEKNLLSEMTRQSPIPKISLQPRFTEKVQKTVFCNTPSEETAFAFAWLTTKFEDQEELFALSVLASVLMETDASPLKSILLQSGLCKQAWCSFDSNMAENPFMICLEGCKEEDGDLLEAIIMSTLEEELSARQIENALHQIELAASGIRADGQPFGLTLFSRVAPYIYRGGNAERGLCMQEEIIRFQKRIAEESHFLSSILQKYIKNNRHFVRLCIKPDSQTAEQRKDRERQTLDEIQNNLTQEKIAAIQSVADALKALQESKGNDELLPKLSLKHISQNPVALPLVKERLGHLDCFYSEAFTNHLTYMDLFFSIPEVKKEDLWLVRLLAVLLPEVGCGEKSAYETLEYIQEHTGGIGAHVGVRTNLQTGDHMAPYFSLGGFSLDRKSNKLASLLLEMITSGDLSDKARIRELVLMHHTNLQESIEQHALPFAINRTLASHSFAHQITEELYGMSYVQKIKQLVSTIDSELDEAIRKMETLLRGLQEVELVVACEKGTYNELKEARFFGLDALVLASDSTFSWNDPLPETCSETFSIAAPIAFHAKGFHTINYSHLESAYVAISSYLFNNLVLHKRIREQGGAYGGASKYDLKAGDFCFFSIRDPNKESTVRAFEEAIDTIVQGAFTEAELDEAKLQLLQHLDAPIAPKDKSLTAYIRQKTGESFEMDAAFRHALFAATKEEVMHAARQHVAPYYKESALITFSGN